MVNLTKAIEGLKERGYYVVGLDGGGDKLVGETGFETDPLVVVLGSEGSGLSRLVRESCDAIAGIPISSSVESLNASVAAGISLYAVSRARMRRVRVRAITRSPVSRACTLRLRAIFRARIRWLVRPLKVVVAAVPVVQARVRVKAVVDSAVVVRAKAVRAVLVPANGVITVRVRAVPHKAAALAVDSVAAKAAAARRNQPASQWWSAASPR